MHGDRARVGEGENIVLPPRMTHKCVTLAKPNEKTAREKIASHVMPPRAEGRTDGQTARSLGFCKGGREGCMLGARGNSE